MSKKEDTPFVIDFKPGHHVNYGTTAASSSSASRQFVTPTNNNNNIQPTPSTLYCLHGQNHVEVRDHCHRQRSEGVDVAARKKLIIASCLCLFFMICEIVGGFLSNSLAIATDAAHLLTDFASFMISLFAIWIAGRPSTKRMSFGWYRAEVIGALASVTMIWFITAILVYLAVQRVIHQDFEVDATIMLITSGLAILVNLIMGVQLQHGHSHGLGGGHGHGHSHGGKSKTNKKSKAKNVPTTIADPTGLSTPKTSRASAITHDDGCDSCPNSPSERLENGVANDLVAVDAPQPATFSYQNSQTVGEVNAEIASVMAHSSAADHHGDATKGVVNLNVRAAYIHVLGDLLQSIGVFFAALLIYFRPDWALADPICTFIFSVIVLFTTFGIMKDALLVLMEGTPSFLQYEEVLNLFQQIEGVKRVHNLRVWALSINKIALNVHLAIAPTADAKQILETATNVVHKRFNFFETTIQIEEFTPQMENCNQCVGPTT